MDKRNLLKRSAIKDLHYSAKTVVEFQIIIVSLPVLIGAFSVFFSYINPQINLFCSLLGFIVTLTNFTILYPKLSKINLEAAIIQQDFDSEVLNLPWNHIKLKRPNFEEIVRLSKKYTKKDPELNKLGSWYSESVDNVPLRVARIICQRKFLGGDEKVRNMFITSVELLVIVLFIMSMVIASVNSLNIGQFLTNLLFPFLPASVFIVRLVQDNNNSIKQSKFLKTKIETIWKGVLESDYSEKYLLILEMQIQDELFEKRKNDPLIFDYLYERFKNKLGVSEYESDSMVNEYLNHQE